MAPEVQSIGTATNDRADVDPASNDKARCAPRVVHVAQTIAGGIASFFEEIAPYQNDAFGKDNVTFVVPEGSEVHLPTIDGSQIVTFAATSRGPAALLSFGRGATKAVRRIAPDIVHLHSSFAGAVLRFSLGRGQDRPRIIYCPHGWAFAMETSNTRKRLYAAIERWLTRRTDLVIANSETERQAARAVTDAPRRLQLAVIGRLDRQKGIDILLRSIERFSLQKIDFHIIGDSVLAQAPAEQSTAGPNVIFHGWLSRADTMKLLRDVDGLVMPSRWDAAPIVAIEAMRAGVPVIGSDRGALPEIIRDGVGGLIFELDRPDSLGELLQGLDRDELRRLGVTARARWEADYNSDQMNQHTVEAYFDVLSTSPSSPSVNRETTRGARVAAANGGAA
jgi:glycosyltransferase involved in cell wall biosynthesis